MWLLKVDQIREMWEQKQKLNLEESKNHNLNNPYFNKTSINQPLRVFCKN